MEIIEILKTQVIKYPKMTPQDAVKLIYQNEFGGGHLIRDKEFVLKRLLNEYEAAEKSKKEEKYEEIGNNIIRVNLKVLRENELPTLCEAFIKSAEIHKGSLLSFKYKLKILWENFENIGFNFEKSELENYLAKYKEENFPMVSHSKIYNELYKPAYRIVRKDLYF